MAEDNLPPSSFVNTVRRIGSTCAIVGIVILAIWSLLGPSRETGRSIPSEFQAGWGCDALLSIFGIQDGLFTWAQVLRSANLMYLRERNPAADSAESWTRGTIANDGWIQKAGYQVVAFAETPGVKSAHSWNQLPEDLLQVYWTSYHLSRRLAKVISVWELPNEPDTLFCRDLPDRLAAYGKAAYLGLKDGNPNAGVLMSALGNFPGPWLSRAAENGLYDYTDGLNVHFYGHARDFRGALLAQESFAKRWVGDRALPIWVTEAGIDAVPHDRLDETRGRETQRSFVLETAKVAMDEKVAVFMPFVLTWPDQPWFALTEGPGRSWPAWTAYAEFTRSHELASQPALAPPPNPSRVVVQWLPDNETCIPQKVSGSYWFRGPPSELRPIQAEIRVYNFASEPVRGTLAWNAESGVLVSAADESFGPLEITIPSFGERRVPVKVRSIKPGYHKNRLEMSFKSSESPLARAVTWVETRPDRKILPTIWPITGTRPSPKDFQWIWAPESYAVSAEAGPWLCVNGVTVDADEPPSTERTPLEQPTFFRIGKKTQDPRIPPMAITRVEGLPTGRDRFLRLSFPELAEGLVRVDLVDDEGQRFSIAENFGLNFFRDDPLEVLLAYSDFHIFAWGRCTGNPIFRPERIREIQLRFYGEEDAVIPVSLEVVGL